MLKEYCWLNKVDMTVMGLLCLSFVSIIYNDVGIETIFKVLPYVFLYIFVRFLYLSCDIATINCFFNFAFLSTGIIISIYSLLQYLQITPSLNPNFTLTGPFYNPGPLGGYLAMIVSIALANVTLCNASRVIRLLSLVNITLSSFVLMLSVSRTAWIALIFTSITIIIKYKIRWIKSHMSQTVALLILFTVLALLPFCLIKTDSAIGRVHIWHIELLAILSKPIFGYGIGKGDYAYGVTQATYFAEQDRSDIIIQVSGSPIYSFNDYLGAGVQIGIIGMVLLVYLIVLSYNNLKKQHSSMAYGLLSLSIFAIGSYPLRIELFIISAIVYIAVPLNNNNNTYTFVNKSYVSFLLGICLSIYLLLSYCNGKHRPNLELIYLKACEYYEKKDYKKSLAVLRTGAAISSSPSFHTMIGKNYEEMNEYECAEKEYLLAHYMSPSRIYPLLCLMKLYNETGKPEKAVFIREQIQNMRVNNNNAKMKELYEEAIKYKTSFE